MKKAYRLLVMTLACVFILAHVTYDANANVNRSAARNSRITVEGRAVSERGLGFTAIGELPVVSFPSNLLLEDEINERIDEIFNTEVFGVRRPVARTFVFSHSIRRSEDIVTILISVSSAVNRPVQNTFGITVDLNNEEIISLSDISGLGINALQVAQQAVEYAISQNPNFSNVNFSGIDNSRSFYLDGSSVVLLFNEGEIAPVHLGVQNVRLETDSIVNMILNRDSFVIREDFYNLNLIPLRLVAEAMGYDVAWNAVTRTGNITRDQFETSVILNRNSYYRVRGVTRSLESAPTQLVVSGTLKTLVPLSFFDQILDVVYSEDGNGNIVFSAYRP
ncbi:MAG: stalk domain-containing protein [Defluviitaleaceae bacterium]|nr:stalk domain-containing protein [Defluviitaleaceae bacterium]